MWSLFVKSISVPWVNTDTKEILLCHSYFPRHCDKGKYSEKSKLRKKGLFWLMAGNCSPSWWESDDGRNLGQWSHCICSQDADQTVNAGLSSFSYSPEAQPMKWCQPHLGWVFLPQLIKKISHRHTLNNPSQVSLEACLLGGCRSCQVDNQHWVTYCYFYYLFYLFHSHICLLAIFFFFSIFQHSQGNYV